MSELQAWVDKLGAMSTTDIREFMQQEGIRGQQCQATTCPISAFLRSKVGQDIRVSNRSIYMHEGVGLSFVRSPASVIGFVSRFDRGDYPELINRD